MSATPARVKSEPKMTIKRAQVKDAGSLILVRIRGTVRLNGKTADTLDMLNLPRPNHAVVVPKTSSYLGMINRVKDYVAYGDIDAETLTTLISQRGRLMGDKPIDDGFVAKATEGRYATVGALAKAVADGKATLKELGDDAKPTFRLHPPTGGHKGSTKKHFTVKGELGYRGKDINQLIKRMI